MNILHLGFTLHCKLTSPLSKESHTLAQSPPLPPVHFLSSQLHRLDRTQDKNVASLFSSPQLLAHHTIFHATSLSHSLLALNDTVYTHPASIIPFHTSPGLFICLGVLGRHEGTLPSSSLSHPPLPSFLLFFPPTTAGCLWPLIYEDLLNPGGPVWSTLGEFGWWRGSVVKTQVIYSSTCCLILLGLVKILLEAASANCSVSLHTFTFCIRLCLVINVCQCRVGVDKNKYCCGIRVFQRVRFGDQWQPACSHHLRIQYVFLCTEETSFFRGI